jgi:hypothetical protein
VSASRSTRLEDRPNNYGLLKDVQTHDQAGNVIETANLDRMGAPVLDRLGVPQDCDCSMTRWETFQGRRFTIEAGRR